MGPQCLPSAAAGQSRRGAWILSPFASNAGNEDGAGAGGTASADIAKAVLKRPAGRRVWLAQSRLDSVPTTDEEVSEAAEMEEAERREREIETGPVRTISEAELERQVQARVELPKKTLAAAAPRRYNRVRVFPAARVVAAAWAGKTNVR